MSFVCLLHEQNFLVKMKGLTTRNFHQIFFICLIYSVSANHRAEQAIVAISAIYCAVCQEKKKVLEIQLAHFNQYNCLSFFQPLQSRHVCGFKILFPSFFCHSHHYHLISSLLVLLLVFTLYHNYYYCDRFPNHFEQISFFKFYFFPHLHDQTAYFLHLQNKMTFSSFLFSPSLPCARIIYPHRKDYQTIL